MNAFAFAADTTTGWMTSAAITLGIAIPTLVAAALRPALATDSYRLSGSAAVTSGRRRHLQPRCGPATSWRW
jgi:hypothetical protein